MKEKVVCFVGHRHDWQNVGIESKLRDIIIDLIGKGYTTFYNGGKGYFDKISAEIVISLKKRFLNIKLFKILTYYHHDKEKWELPSCYDGSIMPEIEQYHYKIRITKRNEWMIDNSDILVCHVYETFKSGAYNMLKYAKKHNKLIVNIE